MSHTSTQCKVLLSKRDNNKTNNGNNKWSKKSSDQSKKDLAVFISKAVRKEMNSFNDKKRKSNNEANRVEIKEATSGSDAKSDDEDALQDFDYGCLDNLSLEGLGITDNK